MKAYEKLPLPLDIVAQDLKDLGLEVIVTAASMVGTDVRLTLKVTLKDINGERDTEESAYDRAMGLIG